ncbi:MAG: TonB-dependent receptor, partial [Acidobacteriaceae bacterium]
MITPVQALRKVTQATPARRNPQLGPPSSRPRRCSSPASQPWFAGFLLLALLVALALPSTPARGQGIITGSISGAITDQTGSIIPGATVTALNAETQLSLSAKTNAEGSFLITNVPVGTYTVTIDASGFSRVTVSQLRVSPGQVTPFGKRSLSPGPTSQTIEVRAGAAQLLNTETSQAESIIDSKQLETVPVDGGFDDVALVVPGVAPTHMDDFSNTNGANFSVNGERGRSNNFEIDGQSNNDNSVGGPQVFFSNQDAIQEVQVITDSFSAQYGRNMGAVVNYVTKSGTNRFHGSAFEFYTGSWLSSLTHSEEAPQFGFCAPDESSADGCTEPVVPRFVQNNFGGTFGGPILKDELFFFGSTFWDRTFQSGSRATSGGAVFPDPNGIKELQSAFPSNPGVAALALNGPYAYTTGNPQPIGATSSLPVTDGNTTANIEMSQFDRTLPQYTLDQEQLGRLDYQATSKDRFYLRYFYQDNPTVPAGGDLASAGYINILAATHSVGGDWTHTFSSNLGNQLRYSFQQAKIAFDGGGVPNCVISNPTPCPSAMGFGSSIASIGYPNNLPQGRVVKVTQVQDNASWTRGRHVWLFGGEFDYQNSPNAFLPNSNGSFDFAPGASGIPLRMPAGSNPAANNGISGIVQGNAQVSLTDGDFTSHFTEPDYALYAQDNWKLFPSLTVNLGLRYEYFGQSINLLHNESVVQQTGSDPYWSTSLPLSATTFPAVSPNYKNIEPRVGFAWNPSFLAKVVVHGGFAINVDPSFSNIFINIADSAPVANAGSFNCDGVTSKCLPSNGLTFGSVQAADAAFIPTGGDPRVNPYQTVPRTFRNPMAETYTLGAQYEVANAGVFEVRYVGNHTFRQFQSINANPDLGDVQAAFPQYGAGLPDCTTPGAVGYNRENCNFNVETSVENTAFSIYNGLQTSFTARDFHHVTGILSYTYSRTIDN